MIINGNLSGFHRQTKIEGYMTKKTNIITKIALMAALQCIISPFAITFPFSPVPISLATLMLYLSAYILGKKNAAISCGIYILIGLIGLPVFSGFTGGIGKVLGPTGGYLTGYLFLVYISGWFVERWSVGGKSSISNGKNSAAGRRDDAAGRSDDLIGSSNMLSRNSRRRYLCYFMQGLGMLLGTAVCYLLGSLWLAYQTGMDLGAALAAGALPFIPGDVVKIVVGVLAGSAVRRRLVKSGVV